MSYPITFKTSDGSTVVLDTDGIQVIPWSDENELFTVGEDRTVFALAFQHDIDVLERMLDFARCIKRLADAQTQDQIDLGDEQKESFMSDIATPEEIQAEFGRKPNGQPPRIVNGGTEALNHFALK